MVVQRCKGSRDLLPDEMARFRLIEDRFRNIAARSGYREVRTPTLEYLHLFTSIGTLTPAMLRRVYSFLDWDGWSGERVVLRPDVTIPVARLYIENLSKEKLARLCYVSNVFRFEGTGLKNRERWQCGLELIGASSSEADAELVRLALATLEDIGIKDVTIRISHGGLVRSLLTGTGLSREEQTEIFDRILEGDVSGLKQLKNAGVDYVRALDSLLEMTGQSSGFLKNFKAMIVPVVPALAEPLDDFISTVDLIEAMGGNCIIDITAGRSFEYYTGVMFQLFSGDSQLGSGGRYDDLIPLVGGKKVPASGLALNIFTIMDLMSDDALPSTSPALLVSAEPGASALALKTITALQRAGYTAVLKLDGGTVATGRELLVKAGGSFDIAVAGGRPVKLATLAEVIDELGKEASR